MIRSPLLSFSRMGLVALGAVAAANAAGPAVDGAIEPVPANATPAELQAYLQANPQPPATLASRDQQVGFFRRLSQARIRAANRLLRVGRHESHFSLALQAKRQCLDVLGKLGDDESKQQSVTYYRVMASDENEEIAAAARRLDAYEKLDGWRELPEPAKLAVAGEARALLTTTPNSLENVRLASNVANVASNNGDGPLAIELVDYLLPRLRDAADPAIKELTPQIEGLSRGLHLPGNFMEVDGQTLDGKPLDWSAYRGKVVLIDYWATWCGPCVADLPNVKRCYEEHRDKGFEIVGVSLDDSREVVAEFVKTNQVPWPTLWNDDAGATGWEHPMAVRYGIRRLPQAILVDQEGRVVHMNAKGAQLTELLQKLLAAPVAAAPPEAGTPAEVATR